MNETLHTKSKDFSHSTFVHNFNETNSETCINQQEENACNFRISSNFNAQQIDSIFGLLPDTKPHQFDGVADHFESMDDKNQTNWNTEQIAHTSEL